VQPPFCFVEKVKSSPPLPLGLFDARSYTAQVILVHLALIVEILAPQEILPGGFLIAFLPVHLAQA
jgi:hypothetical protein